MATHSSILAWRVPWTEEPAGCSPWGHTESGTRRSDWACTLGTLTWSHQRCGPLAAATPGASRACCHHGVRYAPLHVSDVVSFPANFHFKAHGHLNLPIISVSCHGSHLPYLLCLSLTYLRHPSPHSCCRTQLLLLFLKRSMYIKPFVLPCQPLSSLFTLFGWFYWQFVRKGKDREGIQTDSTLQRDVLPPTTGSKSLPPPCSLPSHY